VTNIDSYETLIDFMCDRFEQCDCPEALETCTVGLNEDIADKQEYTLVPGALDRMRAVYKKRLRDLDTINCSSFRS
jgi:hypothetical protein